VCVNTHPGLETTPPGIEVFQQGVKEIVEQWEEMERALGQRSSPGRDGEDDDQQHDGDGGGDAGDHLRVQRVGRRRQSSQEFMDLKRRFEDSKEDKNDDRISKTEQPHSLQSNFTFPEKDGGPPSAGVRRQNLPTNWKNRKSKLIIKKARLTNGISPDSMRCVLATVSTNRKPGLPRSKGGGGRGR
jgi:hypothetical protein